VATEIRAGNAAAEGDRYHGWFVGHFVEPAEDARRTEAVSVKWGVHPAGEARTAWAVNAEATTLSVLVHGRFRITFPSGEYLLAEAGDYVLWPPGTPHHWRAEADSVVLTVRWPSRAGDSVDVAPAADGGSASASLAADTNSGNLA
jgi:hypothetical protein